MRITTITAYGVHHFSTKVSGDLEADTEYLRFVGEHMQTGASLSVDANRGYRMDEALRLVRMAGAIDFMLEKPCATIKECRDLRSRTGVPVMLDEEINTVHDLTRAYHMGAMDALNLKIGRVGGVTKARLLRDVCASRRRSGPNGYLGGAEDENARNLIGPGGSRSHIRPKPVILMRDNPGLFSPEVGAVIRRRLQRDCSRAPICRRKT